MKTSETITKIAAALLKAQSSMGNASKGASNPFFKSSYADLNAIREAVTPALNANGITVLQPTTSENGRSYVETTLLHESGEFLSSLTEIVVAKQNDPQAAGSGISYARRYGLQSFLSVGAADDDGEAAMGRGRSSYKTSNIPKVEVVPLAQLETVDKVLNAAAGQAPAQQAEAKPAAKTKPKFNKPGSTPVASNGAGTTTATEEWT